MGMFVLNVAAVVQDSLVAEVGGLVGMGGGRLGCECEEGEEGGDEGEGVGEHFSGWNRQWWKESGAKE